MNDSSELSITTLFESTDEQALSIMRADGNTRSRIIELLNKKALTQGSPVSTGGAINKNALFNVLGAIGANIGSSVLSSGLYIATANPDTLMKIGKGLSTAVMDAGKIIRHAPFISAQGAILPIAAPIIAYQALQTAVILKEFDVVKKKLDSIQDAVTGLAYTLEVEAFGRLMCIMDITKSLAEEYAYTKRFTFGMLSRLALLEFEGGSLFNRYEFKYRRDMQQLMMPKPVCDELIQDTYGMVLSSIANLQIDELRLKAVMQEEPEYLECAKSKLIGRTAEYNELWRELQNVSRVIKDEYIETTKKINDKSTLEQALPWNWGDNETRKNKASKMLEVSSSFDETFSEPLKNIIEYNNKPTKENIRESMLLFW
jgi:hypothetical protein